jgi:essential nuclear protein 1
LTLLLRQEIDEEDLQALDHLRPPDAGERKTLADLIFAKLAEAEANEANGVTHIKKTRQGKYRTCV